MHSIHSSLVSHCQTSADAPSIIGIGEPAFSYGFLWLELCRAASHLRSQGIDPSDCVVMVIPESSSTALGFLAISSVARCAPLNPAYTQDDFTFYLNDLKPKAVVLPAGYLSPAVAAAEALGIPILRISNEAGFRFEDDLGSDVSSIEITPDPDQIALILHTSGTTSRPKMVALSHANLLTSAKNVVKTLGLKSADRSLNVMPLFHIHGIVAGLLSSLASGGSVVCSPGFQADSFLSWARDYAATWYSAVPTIHQAILDQSEQAQALTEEVRFRLIRSSSAALPPKLFAAMEDHWKSPVIESYGMTEAAHQMTSNPTPSGARKPGSVGLPAGPEVAIVGNDGQPLDRGEVGEIVIRGRNVMHSYLANADATKASFFGSWFRTGDKGRFDDDGYLYIVGRIKEMINRGGENIAPREIDEGLLDHEDILQAVAFAIPHPSLGEDLAAAVIIKDESTITEFDLREYLSNRLAAFKVPTRIVFVDQIPKGPTGKLQRIGLYKKLHEAFSTGDNKPENELEEVVAREFAKVLKLEEIGREVNFFYLGGDSLKALRAAATICEHFGIQLPPGTLFRFPTPMLFAEAIQAELDELRELDGLAEKLRHLPPEEVERLLSESLDS